jgi:glycosyltransferase involved in cell wall biosynthesis
VKNLVSIIIPCYNQAQYLAEAVESVLEQTYTHWECLIINDGSTDNTEEEALKWCSKDSRIKYLKKENGGLSSARNFGIGNSNGKFILPLDADDKIGKEYIFLAVQKLEEDSTIKVVYCRARLFGIEEGEWRMPIYNYKEIFLFNTIFCSALFRREDFDHVGGYDEDLVYGGEDWEFWIRLLKDGGEVFRLNSIQFYYRKKAVSMHTELRLNKEKDKYTEDLIYKKHIKSYQELFGNPLANYRNAFLLEKELKIIQSSRVYNLIKKLWKFQKIMKF